MIVSIFELFFLLPSLWLSIPVNNFTFCKFAYLILLFILFLSRVLFYQLNIVSFSLFFLCWFYWFYSTDCKWITFNESIYCLWWWYMNWIESMNEWITKRVWHQDVLLCAFRSFNAMKFLKTSVSLSFQCVEWNVCLLHLKHTISYKFLSRSFFQVSTIIFWNTAMHIVQVHCCHVQVKASWKIQIKFMKLLNFSSRNVYMQWTQVLFFLPISISRKIMCSQNPLRFCPVNTILNHKSTTIRKF